MQLTEFKKQYSDSDKRTITRVVGCKVWYVHDGRNAWHSTWVKKYREGCFHLHPQSAKQFCEKKRVQGAVFCIQELPALEIDNETGSLFVTQINCRNPLSGYSASAVVLDQRPGKEFVNERRDNYLKVGEPLRNIALTFERDSRFWREPPPVENSLITNYFHHVDWKVFYQNTDGELSMRSVIQPQLLDGSPLKCFQSISSGGERRLGWLPKVSTMEQSGVMSILADIGRCPPKLSVVRN